MDKWNRAIALGFGKQFRFGRGGNLIDDHLYVTAASGIPVITLLTSDPKRGEPFWAMAYLPQDDIHIINRETFVPWDKPCCTSPMRTVADG
ncbi:MAG: hypothetical protein R3B47_06995 [Bacteroidia bacterium]